MFPIDKTVLPSIATRRALLAVDLQNDFVLPDGKLPVTNPSDYVGRTVRLAEKLRALGNVDIIWVRSEFESDRRVENEQILTTDIVQRPRPRARGRQRSSAPQIERIMEQDNEAFLSIGPPDIEKPACVRRGGPGSALAAEVLEVAGKDCTLTKTHYSAFQGSQLLQRLRGHFVTELYICGALTNVGVYATALDAAMHGYEITLVEDCCGYRTDTRHAMATRKLVHLTGCEVSTADELLRILEPAKTKQKTTSKPTSNAKKDGKATTSANAQIPGKANGSSARQDKSARGAVATEEAKAGDMAADESSAKKTDPAGPNVQPPEAGSAKAEPQSRPAAVSPGPLPSPVAKDADSQPNNLKTAEPRDLPIRSKPQSGVSTHDSEESDAPNPANTDNAEATPARPAAVSNRKVESANDSVAKLPVKNRESAKVENGDQEEEEDRQDNSSSSGSVVKADMAGSGKAQVSPPICEGDTNIILDVLPAKLSSSAFELLKAEVGWQRMSHQGGEVPRLVAVQGSVEADGTMPVYRHPADESPPLLAFTPTVVAIKSEVEKHLGHPLNHVLIQLYRDGNDYISEHSDKSLDIAHGSYIANVSLGAERTMVFRTKRVDKDPSRKTKAGANAEASDSDTKKPVATGTSDANHETPAVTEPDPDSLKRQVTRAALPHNSLCRMGLKTNMRWLHSIRQDKRLPRDKSAAELGEQFGGARISLTFRRIATFLSPPAGDGPVGEGSDDELLIWGQGATSKTKKGAKTVVNGQTPEAVRMLQAFGTENHSSEFDWDASYGAGFDVLHMNAAPRFFTGSDRVANGRVGIMLAECGVLAAKGSLGVAAGSADDGGLAPTPAIVKFVDNDPARTTVVGELAILLYLDAAYGMAKTSRIVGKPELANLFSRFQQAMALGDEWRAAMKERKTTTGDKESTRQTPLQRIRSSLSEWEAIAAQRAKASQPGETDAISRPDVDAKNHEDEPDKAAKGPSASKDDASKAERPPLDKGFFMADGAAPSLIDVALWPVVHDIRAVCGDKSLDNFVHLARYAEGFAARASAQKVYPAQQ